MKKYIEQLFVFWYYDNIKDKKLGKLTVINLLKNSILELQIML